jgi:hypothetical protein
MEKVPTARAIKEGVLRKTRWRDRTKRRKPEPQPRERGGPVAKEEVAASELEASAMYDIDGSSWLSKGGSTNEASENRKHRCLIGGSNDTC